MCRYIHIHTYVCASNLGFQTRKKESKKDSKTVSFGKLVVGEREREQRGRGRERDRQPLSVVKINSTLTGKRNFAVYVFLDTNRSLWTCMSNVSFRSFFLGGRDPNRVTMDPRIYPGPLHTYLWSGEVHPCLLKTGPGRTYARYDLHVGSVTIFANFSG